jgi:hypothetical protein
MRIVWRGQRQYAGDVMLDPNVPTEVPDSIAARILQDYAKHGLVEIVAETTIDSRSVDAPPNDRMIRKAPRKRGRK